jgi:hypothetical protein
MVRWTLWGGLMMAHGLVLPPHAMVRICGVALSGMVPVEGKGVIGWVGWVLCIMRYVPSVFRRWLDCGRIFAPSLQNERLTGMALTGGQVAVFLFSNFFIFLTFKKQIENRQ